jgi:hypothetical protein
MDHRRQEVRTSALKGPASVTLRPALADITDRGRGVDRNRPPRPQRWGDDRPGQEGKGLLSRRRRSMMQAAWDSRQRASPGGVT